MMKREEALLPPIAKRQLAWFARYVRRYLRRNFHGLHLLRLADLESVAGLPLVVCLNHPSWWDPLIGVYLSQRFFPDRHQAAPIANSGIQKYKFFERLGFFGIDPGTISGALRFSEIGKAVLNRSDGALWVTPQGSFTDVRQPVVLAPGIGHLVHSAECFAMLPVALEYTFWNERYPEAFACFGEPIIGRGADCSSSEWNRLFARSLQQTVNELSARVQLRQKDLFESLLDGSTGIGGIYDFWRASKARLRGKSWRPEHGGN
jgi:1-acyl-sn-glycerol-3-phosphate acyltransferase